MASEFAVTVYVLAENEDAATVVADRLVEGTEYVYAVTEIK